MSKIQDVLFLNEMNKTIELFANKSNNPSEYKTKISEMLSQLCTNQSISNNINDEKLKTLYVDLQACFESTLSRLVEQKYITEAVCVIHEITFLPQF
ncbi:MAG: hypothetical protein J0H68_06010 [Sphingobacteriia bacterium]|nr:hypothetical protein [Sphingobacteriia bacterium]